jgi:hypothetical protein
MRPPPPPDRDSVFAWSWLGRMEPDDPREPWNVCAGANTDANANADGFRCSTRPSMAADSGYESEMGCDDDDGDSFYYTPEFEDPNEVRRAFPSHYILNSVIADLVDRIVLGVFGNDHVDV